MNKLIGYVLVFRGQNFGRQQADLLAAGVRRDNLYIDHGGLGARASRPKFDRALAALHAGYALVVITLNRLSRRTRRDLGHLANR